jgi:predicted Zn finger-like uncharacterized protein
MDAIAPIHPIEMADPKFTRCPGCATVFRVTPAQLALREGQVRCGHCRAVFDATDHFVSLDAGPAPDEFDAMDELAMGRPTVTLRPAAALQPVAAPVQHEHETKASDAPRSDQDTSDEPAPTAQGVGAPLAEAAVGRAGDETAAAEPAEPTAAEAATADAGTADAGTADAGTTDAGTTDAGTADAGTADAGTADEANRDAVGVADTREPAVAAASEEAAAVAPLAPIDIAHADRIGRFEWKPQRTVTRSRAFYALALIALLAGLALQAVFEFRDALAAHVPATRPLLATACRALACTIEPLRDAAALSIDASDLQADPAHRGLLMLSATIRNRAAHAIAYPYLELTLTDASDRVVVRRAFAPVDYAGGTADTRQGIAPNGERLVRLFLDASATQQAGYRLYLFYP